METTEQQSERPEGTKPVQSQQFAQGQVEQTTVTGDLSREIESTVEREPGDRVRVTWIYGPNYRCNWWSPGSKSFYDNPGMYGLILTTHRVRMSRFLSVRKVGDGLVINDRTRPR
jgi:hypothetical protein